MYANKVWLNVIVILLCSIATSYSVHGLEQSNSSAGENDGLEVTSTTVKIPADPRKIAQEKCMEYAAYRFVNESIESPLISDPPFIHSIRDCKEIDKLIVGGSAADEKEFPHMAAIGFGDHISDIEWICGGSLISEQYILSAAHCTATPAVVEWALLGLLSTQDVSEDKLNENLFRIATTFVHPDYRPPIENYDIALHKLEKPLVLQPAIRPICLYTSEDLATNSSVSATGWGRTAAAEDNSETLMKVTIRIQSNDLCISSYRAEEKFKDGFDSETMVCAGDPFNAKDTCQGDSGGPLQVPLGDEYECMWTQIAITSIGSTFCGSDVPSIYTKVSHFLPWIQRIVWPDDS